MLSIVTRSANKFGIAKQFAPKLKTNFCQHLNQHLNQQKARFSSSFDKKLLKDLPKFAENNSNTNVGLIVGAVIIAGGVYYFLKDDDKVSVSPNCYSSADSTSMDLAIRAKTRIKETYGYVLSGLGITAASATGFYKAGFHRVIMRTNPFVYLGVSLATSIPLLIGTMATDYHDNKFTKQILWTGFNVSMAGGLCTIGLVGGPLIAQAALATGCVVGGLSLAASKAKPGSLEQFEAPLGIGLGVVVAAGLGSMFFPMPILHSISLYGGLAVFSGLTMTDTQKLIKAAQQERDFDPINESLGIYLDTLNIFIRMVEILNNLQNGKKSK